MAKQSRSLPQVAADVIDSAMGLVCILPATGRTERRASVHAVLSEAISWKELENGVSFSFTASDAMARSLFDLVLAERDCCAQFKYSILFEPHHQPIELRVEANGPLLRLLKGLFVGSPIPPGAMSKTQPNTQSLSIVSTRKARVLGAIGLLACIAGCVSLPGGVSAISALGFGFLPSGGLLIPTGVPSGLTIFGLFAVSAMLLCYAFEARSHWFVLGFALSCALGSVYGFLQGAWPFGLVEFIWTVVAMRRWTVRRWTVRRFSSP